MELTDRHYSILLSNEVERYKVKSESPFRANFRCPLCGDSEKSKIKARGWILEKDNIAIFYCHNCGESLPLGALLKRINPALYDSYIVDRRLNNIKRPVESLTIKQKEAVRNQVTPNKEILSRLKKISSLSHDHYAKKFVVGRKIPSMRHYLLYHTDNFNSWTNSLLPNKLDDSYDEPRLVIPFRSKTKKIVGYTGRDYKKTSKLRYITIMLDPTAPKIFGLERLDPEKNHLVFEGPIDSLFMPNSIAMAGSAVDFKSLENPEKAIFVFDIEYRNRELVEQIERTIAEGLRVCLLPPDLGKQGKDVNDLILSGIKASDLYGLILRETYEGLQAKLKLAAYGKKL